MMITPGLTLGPRAPRHAPRASKPEDDTGDGRRRYTLRYCMLRTRNPLPPRAPGRRAAD
jgi:hypothetical protein